MRPFTLLIKPAGPDCNLACKYCFYSGKGSLFGTGRHRMSADVLDKLISDYMKLKFAVSSFAWQGGEPTLMGLDFYKKVVELQKKYGCRGRVVSNAVQTNGILLDRQWCRFFREYKFLIGISLDGPGKMHDYYRVDSAGSGSYERVMTSIETCREHKVQFNILTLLNNKNVAVPDELFDFFVANRIRYLQFIPCVEKDPVTGDIASFAVTPAQYGNFLCGMFDRWVAHGPGEISIRMFDSILSWLVNGRSSICTFAKMCDDYVVIEHNGDVFCCDFFVRNEWKLGNVLLTPIEELMGSGKKRTFAGLKRDVANNCFVCRHKAVCCGGCLKDRVVINEDFKQKSYFCESYRQFFDYALPKFAQIAAELSRRVHQ